MSAPSSSEVVIACNPNAIDPEQREAHGEVAKAIFSASNILETKELTEGYAFRLPLEASMLHQLAAWIANERLCCPFFTFSIIVHEQLWLELSGTPEVKNLIRAEILPMITSGDFPSLEILQAG